MSDKTYIVIHDEDILARDLNDEEAVLFAARYDGWGASFARDQYGAMALRRSSRHIGNNHWSATGEEPELFNANSALEDDERAIEDCVQQLIFDIEMLHKLMEVQETDDYIRQRLRLALDEYEGQVGPGEWLVDMASNSCSSPAQPALCYKWPEMDENHPNWGDCDFPWKKWGGNLIIEAAGCVRQNGTMLDGVDCALVRLMTEEDAADEQIAVDGEAQEQFSDAVGAEMYKFLLARKWLPFEGTKIPKRHQIPGEVLSAVKRAKEFLVDLAKEREEELIKTNFSGTELAFDDDGCGIEFVNGKPVVHELPTADDSASDGQVTVKLFKLDAVHVFVTRTEIETTVDFKPEGTTIKEFIKDFECGDMDLNQVLASFGFDGTPEEAPDDAVDVRIWREPCYFAGAITTDIGGYVYEENGSKDEHLIFATVKEAQAWIDDQVSKVYVTRSNEAGRPVFTICV